MKRLPLAIPVILLLCFYANAQSTVDLGTTNDGTYTNAGFGFSFKYPKDWVVHGDATNQRLRELGKERMAETGAASKTITEVALQNTYNLLTLFRHAIGTPGITFNPGILVIAEKVDYAPGVTTGKDYLLGLRTLMQKSEAQVLLKEPVEYHFGGSQFFRDNFIVESNGVQVYQGYFARIVNGYALVFVFMGPDEKSVDEMAKAMETYTAIPQVRRGIRTTIIGTPEPTPKPH